MRRIFQQVDVFGAGALRGNPLAVVVDADGLGTEQMQRFANWTNLSETTFLLPPTAEGAAAGADYRVRIFTGERELPFAGHPTIGSCHAWLATGGVPTGPDIVQECAAGLVRLRRDGTDGDGDGDRLAFAAPPLLRSGPVEEPLVQRIAAILGVARTDLLDAEWVDNGPGWVAVLLADADAVLAVRPTSVGDLDLGVVGLHTPADRARLGADLEVRAFYPLGASTGEDPVTGSLNASLAPWLVRTGRITLPYVARQGTALDRDGRVHLFQDADGVLWVGGAATTCIEGHVEL